MGGYHIYIYMYIYIPLPLTELQAISSRSMSSAAAAAAGVAAAGAGAGASVGLPSSKSNKFGDAEATGLAPLETKWAVRCPNAESTPSLAIGGLLGKIDGFPW